MGVDAREVLAAEVRGRMAAPRPVLVGVSGGVGVGKSTLAASLRDDLARDGVKVEVVGTDAFLLPNDELERQALTMRKGFPESFDTDALRSFVEALRAHEADVRVPVYSHTTYDRVPGAERKLEPADVVIIEGVNALQEPVVGRLDSAVYIEATEADQLAWFVERFLAFCEAALDDETSFYRGFTGMSVAQQRDTAEWTWREINAVNLHDHIAPSRTRATVVVTKQHDHSMAVGAAG
jgi:type I pantothenate kinase